MDLIITLIILLIFIFWPRLGQLRYYLLFAAGIFILFIALVFAPMLLLSPLFYLGIAVMAAMIIYKGIIRSRKEKDG